MTRRQRGKSSAAPTGAPCVLPHCGSIQFRRGPMWSPITNVMEPVAAKSSRNVMPESRKEQLTTDRYMPKVTGASDPATLSPLLKAHRFSAQSSTQIPAACSADIVPPIRSSGVNRESVRHADVDGSSATASRQMKFRTRRRRADSCGLRGQGARRQASRAP
jgi:hypothetical protein